jgi:hypothetical protein
VANDEDVLTFNDAMAADYHLTLTRFNGSYNNLRIARQWKTISEVG